MHALSTSSEGLQIVQKSNVTRKFKPSQCLGEIKTVKRALYFYLVQTALYWKAPILHGQYVEKLTIVFCPVMVNLSGYCVLYILYPKIYTSQLLILVVSMNRNTIAVDKLGLRGAVLEKSWGGQEAKVPEEERKERKESEGRRGQPRHLDVPNLLLWVHSLWTASASCLWRFACGQCWKVGILAFAA